MGHASFLSPKTRKALSTKKGSHSGRGGKVKEDKDGNKGTPKVETTSTGGDAVDDGVLESLEGVVVVDDEGGEYVPGSPLSRSSSPGAAGSFLKQKVRGRGEGEDNAEKKSSPWGTGQADRGPKSTDGVSNNSRSARAPSSAMKMSFARLGSKVVSSSSAGSSHSRLPKGGPGSFVKSANKPLTKGGSAKTASSGDDPDTCSSGSSLNSDDMEQAAQFERRVSLVHDPFIDYSSNAKKSMAEKMREKREAKKQKEAAANAAAAETLRKAQAMVQKRTEAAASAAASASAAAAKTP